MTTLVGRRGIGGFYLLHNYPWLVVAALVIVVAVAVYMRRNR